MSVSSCGPRRKIRKSVIFNRNRVKQKSSPSTFVSRHAGKSCIDRRQRRRRRRFGGDTLICPPDDGWPAVTEVALGNAGSESKGCPRATVIKSRRSAAHTAGSSAKSIRPAARKDTDSKEDRGPVCVLARVFCVLINHRGGRRYPMVTAGRGLATSAARLPSLVTLLRPSVRRRPCPASPSINTRAPAQRSKPALPRFRPVLLLLLRARGCYSGE